MLVHSHNFEYVTTLIAILTGVVASVHHLFKDTKNYFFTVIYIWRPDNFNSFKQLHAQTLIYYSNNYNINKILLFTNSIVLGVRIMGNCKAAR